MFLLEKSYTETFYQIYDFGGHFSGIRVNELIYHVEVDGLNLVRGAPVIQL